MEKSSIDINHIAAGFYLVTTENYQNELMDKEPSEVGKITTAWITLPFLSLRENLLLGVSKNRRAKIFSYFQLVDLSPTILRKSTKELTDFEKIKLQFVHFLLQEKEVLFLDQSCQNLATSGKQWLLNFCHKLTQTKRMKIFLFSQDEQLIHLPIIDDII